MNDRVPLDREESVFASWLATLDNPLADPRLRAEAVKQLASMYMTARTNEVSLGAQLESAQRENVILRRELALDIMSRVRVTPAVQAPGHKPYLWLVERKDAEPVESAPEIDGPPESA